MTEDFQGSVERHVLNQRLDVTVLCQVQYSITVCSVTYVFQVLKERQVVPILCQVCSISLKSSM